MLCAFRFWNFGLIIVAIGLTIVYAQVQKEVKPKPKTADIVAPLPASLDNLFPPKTEQPVYLFRMLGMSKPFTGIVVDLFENDIENVSANFEKFRTQYLEVSKLVPEWESYFPLEPVDELGTALKTGDQEKVMAAVQQVSKVCSDCHIPNMPRVQHKYHWGNFNAITVTDPLTKQEVIFQQLMLFIEANFTGIEVDVEQDQIENAQRQFQGFRARFQAMGETCMNCHDTERHYYVDESVMAMIDKLGQALSASPVDPNIVGKLSLGIGMESCFKCHLVHVPAAAAQLQMAK
jgi:hypothetical protein